MLTSAAGDHAAAAWPAMAEYEPDLSDLLWDSADLLSLSDLLDTEDAAWPAADGVPLPPQPGAHGQPDDAAPLVRPPH